MRLSAKKAAHRFSQRVPRSRTIREAMGLLVVFFQGKPRIAASIRPVPTLASFRFAGMASLIRCKAANFNNLLLPDDQFLMLKQ
jgi:hypothetical protein